MTNLKQRPINFRAWVLSTNGEDHYMLSPEQVALDFNDHYTDENTVLMQFTGLFDKSGVEIYEGDIVKFRSHPEKERVGAIRWHEATARFYISIPGEISIRGIRVNDQMEVIGNIYEHMELLNDS